MRRWGPITQPPTIDLTFSFRNQARVLKKRQREETYNQSRRFSRRVRLVSLLHYFLSLCLPPFADVPQGVLEAGDGCPRARNRTSRLRFWAVAAKRNCSATFQSRRSRTRRRRMRCLSSPNKASIVYRVRCERT